MISTFSVRELRQQTGVLIHEAEKGGISIITKHGKPSVLAVPFTEKLLSLGVNKDIALELYRSRNISLIKAAKLAGISAEEFLEMVKSLNIPCVDYPPEEIDLEAEAIP